MQSNWYHNDGAVGGIGSVVYDGGGGYYGCESVSFYGPPAMGARGFSEKPKPDLSSASCYLAEAGPGSFAGNISSATGSVIGSNVPYEYTQQGLVPHQPPLGMLYNHTQMMAPTAMEMGSNNDYQRHQQPLVPPSNHRVVGTAYRPFCSAQPPSHQQPLYGTELGKSSELVSQNSMNAPATASFLEQPYVAANYAPCQGPPPWNYAYCYGYYGQEPCPYVNMVDMEDFMNNEKRKEKSRDAARCRRSRETEIFQDLASLLPMRPEEVEHLDKASVMRLSIAFLKARNMLDLFPELSQIGENMEIKEDNDESMDSTEGVTLAENKLSLKSLGLNPEVIALQALDGFLMILSADGDVTYISENVHEYLGISQIDIMGQPIWDYSHQCDHDELREALNGRRHSPSELLKGVANSDCRPMENRDFFLRLKCTLTSRGRSVNIKSASYKVLHVTGHIACKDKEGQRQLVSIARPLPHPSNIEVPLGTSTFLTQHTLSMKFSYVDDIMLTLLGYQPSDLLGKSLYECHHGSDAEHVMTTFKHVISKGQSETSRYRFLAKTGGYAWVVTQATVINDKQKPHSIVCVNYVLSGVENKDDILSCAQLEARQQLLSEDPEKCTENGDSVVCHIDQFPHEQQHPATTSLPPACGTVLEEVKVEETISIPSRCGVVQTPSFGHLPEPVPALGAKNNLVASEALPQSRILREPNILPKTVSPSSSGSRPVSVTASIFTSLPSGTVGSEKVRAPIRQPPVLASPQSVTAKLFVTLPPANGGASAANCNGGVSSAGSGAGSKPQHATEKIFAPRTEDMNKGFLMFSEEEPGLTMLKDEPDDLTHLAPTAGDACIPLEESGTFFNEMFEDFIIPDSYTLLQEELCSLDSQDTRLDGSSIVVPPNTIGIPVSGTESLTNALSTASVASSPLGCSTSGSEGISEPNSASQTRQPHLSANPSCSSPTSISVSTSPVPSSPSRSHISSNPNSPSGTSGLGSSASSTVSTVDGRQHHATIDGSNQHNATSNDPFINYRDEATEVSPSPHLLSPGMSKSPESSSLPSLCSPNGSLPEDELAFMSLNMDDIDLSMRAPYISMSEVDDLPLLTSDDLLWGVPAAAVEGTAPSSSISAFGLAGKFFIKDEFSAIGTSSNSNTGTLTNHQGSPTAVDRPLLLGKEHGLIIDVASDVNAVPEGSITTSATVDSIIELAGNNGNNDSKSTLTTTSPPSIDSSLAALLSGDSVISIQSETSNLQQTESGNHVGSHILITHTNASLNSGAEPQQQHRQTSQQPHQLLQNQQLQVNNVQRLDTAPIVKRVKLSDQNLLQHSMVVLPANVKLCDAWKFDDLLQLNGGGISGNGKTNPQQSTTSQANIIASFVSTATKKPVAATGINGNNKRTLNGVSDTAGDSGTGNTCKRLKASSVTNVGSALSSPSSAPQLLQQLMAPSPVPQKLKSKSRSSQDATGGGRWPNGHTGGPGGLLHEQSGNSVLMNLLVSGCDEPVTQTPPKTLSEDTVTELPLTTIELDRKADEDMLFNFGDDDDNGVLFSSTNPLIGGQGPLNDAIARPLTIQTEHFQPKGQRAAIGNATGIRSGKLFAGMPAGMPDGSSAMDDLSMIVSPSLLTPTDMEIWRAIQQGVFDPKKIPAPSYYGAATVGNHIPQSLSGTPTAPLSELLEDPTEANLLTTLDAGLLGDLDVGVQSSSLESTDRFRTIVGNEHGLI